jgi:mannose-6-phosphate isomerase-like protein (cupin superfamily)
MRHEIVEIAPPGPPADPRKHWPQHLREEFERNQFSGVVGNVLVSETEAVRVWHLSMPPGGWLSFHRHVLDYFWTTPTAGVARGYYEDGRIVDVHHYPGETRHFQHGRDEHFVHAIENVGDTELVFITVEFLQGANPPIQLPQAVRLDANSQPQDADAKVTIE